MTPWYAAMTAPVSGEISACASPRLGAGPAQVATSDACSMRKSAGCMVGGDADHSNPLLFRRRSAGDGHVAPGHAQHVGKYVNQFGIGCAIHRRCVQPDEQRTVPRAGDAGPAGAGNHPYVDHDALRSCDNHGPVLDSALPVGWRRCRGRDRTRCVTLRKPRGAMMPSPFGSARLNLQLFDLRREPVLREARAWFLSDFNPDTLEEFMAVVAGERNASFRMVLGYWDMAASIVTTGAIDAEAFRSAHTEVFGTFCKIQPFLEQLRTASGEMAFCEHLESVVMGAADAAAILERRRTALRAAAARRAIRP